MAYICEVVEHEPGERFVMWTSDGSFPMETIYVCKATPMVGPAWRFASAVIPQPFPVWSHHSWP